MFAYLTDKAYSGTGLEHELIQNVAMIKYHVLPLGAFLCCMQYAPIDRLAYSRTVFGCGGCGAQLYVTVELIRT